MAIVEYKLSKHEQWAQELDGNLKGIIPLANFWAYIIDAKILGGYPAYLNHLLFDLLNSKKGRTGWLYVRNYLRKAFTKNQKQDYISARQSARRQFDSLEQFNEAERIMMVELLVEIFSVKEEE